MADPYNGKVRRLKDGVVATAASGLSHPEGVAAVGERLLVADTGAHRLVWVAPTTGALEPVVPPGGAGARYSPARKFRESPTVQKDRPTPLGTAMVLPGRSRLLKSR